MENVAGEAFLSNNFIHTILLSFFKNSDCHKISSLMSRASNLTITMFSTCRFHFWHSLSYMYSPEGPRNIRKVGHVMVQLQKNLFDTMEGAGKVGLKQVVLRSWLR